VAKKAAPQPDEPKIAPSCFWDSHADCSGHGQRSTGRYNCSCSCHAEVPNGN
jgi:hypothetical protein